MAALPRRHPRSPLCASAPLSLAPLDWTADPLSLAGSRPRLAPQGPPLALAGFDDTLGSAQAPSTARGRARAAQRASREHPANVAAPPRPERPQRRSILQTVFRRTPPDADAGADAPADCAHEPPAPRSKSRNGPNGIVIGAPRPMASKKGVEVSIVVPPPTYQYGRE